LRRLLSACAHACARWTEKDGRCARSIFAGVKVLFDESLGVSTEVRTAYAVFIILSIFVAAVSFVYRIVAARSVHQVRPATHAARAQLARIGRSRTLRMPPGSWAVFVCAGGHCVPSRESAAQRGKRRGRRIHA
jgi:hypothetical protein